MAQMENVNYPDAWNRIVDMTPRREIRKPLCLEVHREGQAATVYDTGTNRLLRLDSVTADLLPFWDKPLRKEKIYEVFKGKYTAEQIDLRVKLLKRIEKERKLLVRRRPTRFVQRFDMRRVREELSHHLDMVVLQVTTACNFRCSYCIYNGRHRRYHTLDARLMELGTAKEALKFFEAHSSRSPELSVNFYGGEPLLNLPVIRWVIKSLPSIARNRPYSFNITTNGSLLDNEETVKLLAKANVFLLVSLDGPRTYHNARRRTINGEGTFDRIIDNLTLMERIEPEYFHRNVQINSVLDTANDLPSLRDFLLEHPLLSQQEAIVSRRTKGESDGASEASSEMREFKQFEQEFLDQIEHGPRTFDRIMRSAFLNRLQDLHTRCLYDGVSSEESFFKCVAGQRFMVDPDGWFHVCPNVADDVLIGDVEHGFNFREIERIMRAYEGMRSSLCPDCWAFRLCKLCYLHAFVGDKIDMENQKKVCLREKARIAKLLSRYCRVLDRNHNAFDFALTA